MKILVCIKQVPSAKAVKINPETNTLVREGIERVLNPFDSYAIEEGLRLKERYAGIVDVVTMGPPQAEEVLREAISLGADNAFLLCDRAFAGADTLATAATLASFVRKQGGYDLIICGKQTIDGDTAQVGPGLAEKLGMPQITFVKKVREVTKENIIAERMIEEGFEVVATKLPALITVVKEINEPRLPSLKGMIAAKKKEINNLNLVDIGLDENLAGLKGSPTRVVKIFSPEIKSEGEMLEGEAAEQVKALMERLKKINLI